MSSNQVSIPVLTTPDTAQNQIQQNVNKVLRNFINQITSLQSLVNEAQIIGEIKLANLTLSQFQSIAGSGWILANGQSSVNTSYSKLTGNNTVPNISVTGTTAFIKVN